MIHDDINWKLVLPIANLRLNLLPISKTVNDNKTKPDIISILLVLKGKSFILSIYSIIINVSIKRWCYTNSLWSTFPTSLCVKSKMKVLAEIISQKVKNCQAERPKNHFFLNLSNCLVCQTEKISQAARTKISKNLSNNETVSSKRNSQFKNFVKNRNRFEERLNWPIT